MRSTQFLLILVLASSAVFAQDWKTLYDQGKQSYDAQQYALALTNAEKAYDLATKTDAKSEAFTLQLLTAICLDGGFADKGLTWSEEEMKKFATLEGENSKHYYGAARKQAQLLQQAGQLPLAAEKNALLCELAKKIHGPESYEYYASSFSHAQVLMQLNSFRLSQEIWTRCLPKLKQFPEGNEDYFYGLYYAAFVDHKMEAWQDAARKWTEFVSIADQNNLQDADEYKQARVFLADLQKKGITALSPTGGKSIQQQLATALDYQNKKQWDFAAQEYASLEKNITPENIVSSTVFSHYLNYGRLLYQQHKFDEAYSKAGEAKKIAEKLFPAQAAEHGYLQYLEAELKLAEGKTLEAQTLYTTAFANLKLATPAIQTTYLLNTGRSMLSLNQPQFVLVLMQPLSSTCGVPGADNRYQLDFIITYCDALMQLNRNNDAATYLKEKIALSTAPAKPMLQVKLAEALKESGSWQDAVSLLQSVLNTPSLAPHARAEACYQLARTQQQLGQHVAAEKNYLAALDLYQRAQSENAWQVLNSLATFYTQLGNYEAAENIYIDALKSIPPTAAFGNTLKQNLAAVYQLTMKLPRAQLLLEEVVQSEKASGNAMSAQYAITIQNLAALYQHAGEYEKAKAHYNEAMDIDRRNFGEQSLNYASKMANLAVMYEESGELDKARTLLESALKTMEIKLGTEHPDYVFNQYNLAVLHHRMKAFALARPLYKKIAVFYVKQIHELFPALSEQEKAAFYNKIQEIIIAYQDFAVDYANTDKNIISELLDFRLQTKALLLNSSTTIRNRILSSGDPALIEKFTNWLRIKEQLALILSLPLDERTARKNIADDLQQRANTAEKELSEKSEFFASATEKKSVTWRDVQAALKPGEAAVEMIRLRLNLKNDSVIYVALVVKPGLQLPEMVTMPRGRAMELREFSYYANTIRYWYHNERSHQIYWKMLEHHLEGVHTLYFAPDGVYNKINVLTLFDVGRNQYLIDRFSLKLVSNLKDVLLKPHTILPPPAAVLVGYPDYLQNAVDDHTHLLSTSAEKSPAAFKLVRGGIDPLPGTKEEVLKVESLLKNSQWNVLSHLSGAATEEVIKAQRSPALLHIATHGFFIEAPKKDGELVYSQSILQAESNPLLRSGLLLAGAEKNLVDQLMGKARGNTEDGVFTAYEAMNMNLQNTGLVVLSACETGIGEVRNGEGVYGLQRSFLVAGADNVMMSLWKVNDEATHELMVLFYSNWLALKDKRKAFHETQLALKKKYSDPFYWGAFVMIGQ